VLIILLGYLFCLLPSAATLLCKKLKTSRLWLCWDLYCVFQNCYLGLGWSSHPKILLFFVS